MERRGIEGQGLRGEGNGVRGQREGVQGMGKRGRDERTIVRKGGREKQKVRAHQMQSLS